MVIFKVSFAVLFLLCYYTVSTASTIKDARKLFRNTIDRWDVHIKDEKDRRERWQRLLEFKEVVDRSTSDILLDSLNRFSVNNDDENEQLLRFSRQGADRVVNGTMPAEEAQAHHHLVRRSVSAPARYSYWESEVGLQTPGHQGGCGACWAFPTTGAIEALYASMTGDQVNFSEQFFVDCSFEFSGCTGGQLDDGFRLTMMRQYLVSEADMPFRTYSKCADWVEQGMQTGILNALKKIWLTSKVRVSQSQNAMMSALVNYSPVAFSLSVGPDIFAYSGGLFSDVSCISSPLPHAFLLVGYDEHSFRVKGSYGATWGDGGYVNYKRSDLAQTMLACNIFERAVAITAIPKYGEMEYAWCNGAFLSKRFDCKTSCLSRNNEQEQGWDLAIIPTVKHNEEVLNFIWASYPNLKTGTDRDFYQLWIGIFTPDSTTNILQLADQSDFHYVNVTTARLAGQWGMIDARSGSWTFRNDPNSYARGICSRTILCPRINLENGQVEYEWGWAGEKAVEGTIVRLSCNSDYSLKGEEEMVCGGDGRWGRWGVIPVCRVPRPEDASETPPMLDNIMFGADPGLPDNIMFGAEPELPEPIIYGVRRMDTAAGKKKKKKKINKQTNKKKGGKWKKNKG